MIRPFKGIRSWLLFSATKRQPNANRFSSIYFGLTIPFGVECAHAGYLWAYVRMGLAFCTQLNVKHAALGAERWQAGAGRRATNAACFINCKCAVQWVEKQFKNKRKSINIINDIWKSVVFSPSHSIALAWQAVCPLSNDFLRYSSSLAQRLVVPSVTLEYLRAYNKPPSLAELLTERYSAKYLSQGKAALSTVPDMLIRMNPSLPHAPPPHASLNMWFTV